MHSLDMCSAFKDVLPNDPIYILIFTTIVFKTQLKYYSTNHVGKKNWIDKNL